MASVLEMHLLMVTTGLGIGAISVNVPNYNAEVCEPSPERGTYYTTWNDVRDIMPGPHLQAGYIASILPSIALRLSLRRGILTSILVFD